MQPLGHPGGDVLPRDVLPRPVVVAPRQLQAEAAQLLLQRGGQAGGGRYEVVWRRFCIASGPVALERLAIWPIQ
jgi:hypothetical protein